MVSKKVPSWAPDRKQMPVIDESKLPAAAKALTQGLINWRPPYPVEEGEPLPGAKAAAIRLASSLPKGSDERKALLKILKTRTG